MNASPTRTASWGSRAARPTPQVKAAHRRLAKRFHPDAPDGDTDRFLAVQEAYSLLSDPLRRREWDARHAPGPVRAGEPGVRSRPRTRGSDGRWTRSDGQEPPGAGRGRGRSSREGPADGTAGDPAAGQRPAGGRGRQRRASPSDQGGDDRTTRAETAWSASERDPATRSYTWSAAGVPWWEDFTPRDRRPGSETAEASPAPPGGPARPRGTPAQGDDAAGTRTRAGRPVTGRTRDTRSSSAGPAEPVPGTDPGRANEMDVYNRSSGAAWSMAARRYFRRGDAELPSGGAFRYRGTQVVTGAEARRVAAEEAHRASAGQRRETSPDAPPAATSGAPAATSGAPAATESGSAEWHAADPPTVHSPPPAHVTPDAGVTDDTGSAVDGVLGRVGRLFRGR